MNNMAFVCWNRYLDLSEAIEEGDTSLLENTDFLDTDVPFDVELPAENLPVRQWRSTFCSSGFPHKAATKWIPARRRSVKKYETGCCKHHWIKR